MSFFLVLVRWFILIWGKNQKCTLEVLQMGDFYFLRYKSVKYYQNICCMGEIVPGSCVRLVTSVSQALVLSEEFSSPVQ